MKSSPFCATRSLLGVGVSVLLFAFAGCLQSPIVDCGNGVICAAGQVCFHADPAAPIFCATQVQIDACTDPNGISKPDGTPCGEGASLDRCFNGFCQPSLCGNGVIDVLVGEACEADNVAGLPTCQQRGYDGGVVGCDACTVDTNTCESYCGDGVVDDDEECDGEAVNPELAIACSAAGGPTRAEFGGVTCGRDCRIDTSRCAPLLRGERVATLPPLPSDASPSVIFAVDENEVWLVDELVSQRDSVSYFAHWTGDRWRRGFAGDVPFVKNAHCDQLWATRGAAFAGCSDGTVIKFDQFNGGTALPLVLNGGAVVGIFGFAADQVWAGQGNQVWRFNGSTWIPDGAPFAGNILAIDGDSENVYLLTTTALFHRQSAGPWTAVLQQPAGPPTYSFENLKVGDATHIWLFATQAMSLPTLVLYEGPSHAAVSSPTIVLLGAAQLLDATPTALYTSENGNIVVREIGRYVSGDVSAALAVSQPAILATGHGASAGQDSVWILDSESRVVVRAATPTIVPAKNKDDTDLLVPARNLPNSPFITQGRDGTLYFSIANGGLYVMDTHNKLISAVTNSQLSGKIEGTPFEGPTGEKLLLAAQRQLFALDDANRFVAMAPKRTAVRGIWSDGRNGFVVDGVHLYQYEGIDTARWTSLATLPFAPDAEIFLAGGLVNSTDTLWIVPADLNGVNQIMRVSVVGRVATTTMIDAPPEMRLASAVWSSGPELWVSGFVGNSGIPFLMRWLDGRWEKIAVPRGASATITSLWSGTPGQVWLLLTDATLLRYDGSRWWSTKSPDGAIDTLGNSPTSELWALVKLKLTDMVPVGLEPQQLVHLVQPHPPITGGLCPAQQELFCRENGHGVTEGPRTISTIVGGRFGTAHYVLNSSILGNVTFAGNLPPEVEAVWALPDPSGTCPTGAPLGFASSGTGASATQTLGPSRYFLSLRARNPADTTEYPVTLDYSCHRID